MCLIESLLAIGPAPTLSTSASFYIFYEYIYCLAEFSKIRLKFLVPNICSRLLSETQITDLKSFLIYSANV